MAKYGPSYADNLWLGAFFVALYLLFRAVGWLWTWAPVLWPLWWPW